MDTYGFSVPNKNHHIASFLTTSPTPKNVFLTSDLTPSPNLSIYHQSHCHHHNSISNTISITATITTHHSRHTPLEYHRSRPYRHNHHHRLYSLIQDHYCHLTCKSSGGYPKYSRQPYQRQIYHYCQLKDRRILRCGV